jgi:hypothetical protein
MFKKMDDEMHFWAGILIWFFVFFIANFWFNQSISSSVGFGVAIIAAIGKELYDKHIKKTKFDWRDLKWTVIGASIPAVLFIIFDIIYYYSKP